jgi:hypothetical protein
MPINKTSKELKTSLIINLEKHYGVVKKISTYGEVYDINGKRINIRCRTKSNSINESRLFWYSFNYSLADRVDYVLYMMTTSEYFILFPVAFLEEIKSSLYHLNDNPSTKTFYIDWDQLLLLHKDGVKSISDYHKSFSVEDPNFPTEFI